MTAKSFAVAGLGVAEVGAALVLRAVCDFVHPLEAAGFVADLRHQAGDAFDCGAITFVEALLERWE